MKDLEKSYETRLETIAQQIDRLKVRFGEKHFDEAFIILLRREWKNLSEDGIKDCVSYLVGNRPAHKPPLIPDFTRARIGYEEKKFKENMAWSEEIAAREQPTAEPDGDADKRFIAEVGASSILEAYEKIKERRSRELPEGEEP